MHNFHDTKEAAIQAAIDYVDKYEGTIEFEGFNCDDVNSGDNCTGWDGVDRRCECGNRRVHWLTSQNSDGKWSAYAVAY
jgi:hypothetical protein